MGRKKGRGEDKVCMSDSVGRWMDEWMCGWMFAYMCIHMLT